MSATYREPGSAPFRGSELTRSRVGRLHWSLCHTLDSIARRAVPSQECHCKCREQLTVAAAAAPVAAAVVVVVVVGTRHFELDVYPPVHRVGHREDLIIIICNNNIKEEEDYQVTVMLVTLADQRVNSRSRVKSARGY